MKPIVVHFVKSDGRSACRERGGDEHGVSISEGV